MKQIEGDIRVYATINTSEYNGDGKYSIIVSDLKELEKLGWDTNENYYRYGSNVTTLTIGQMEPGDIVLAEECGAYLMRIA